VKSWCVLCVLVFVLKWRGGGGIQEKRKTGRKPYVCHDTILNEMCISNSAHTHPLSRTQTVKNTRINYDLDHQTPTLSFLLASVSVPLTSPPRPFTLSPPPSLMHVW